MFQKLKQYKDLRQQAKQVQSTLSAQTYHADAWGGNVSVIMDGNQTIMALDIKPDVLKPENKERIEKAVKDCMGDAIKKIQRDLAAKIQKGELKLPDLPK